MLTELYRDLNEVTDILDNCNNLIEHAKAHCHMCDGCGEIQPNCFDHPPETCETCKGRDFLLRDIKKIIEKLHERMRLLYYEINPER